MGEDLRNDRIVSLIDPELFIDQVFTRPTMTKPMFFWDRDRSCQLKADYRVSISSVNEKMQLGLIAESSGKLSPIVCGTGPRNS
jgi:hypothetical protein